MIYLFFAILLMVTVYFFSKNSKNKSNSFSYDDLPKELKKVLITVNNEDVEYAEILDEDNFVVFDFETANKNRHSAVQIGIAIVKENKLVDSKSYLLKPYSETYFEFTYLHGISIEDVLNQPTFSDLWDDEFEELFTTNTLVAYNISFDLDVLTKCLNWGVIDRPKLKVACAYQFTKKHVKGLSSYKLQNVTKEFKIDHHAHRAEDDAIATAELILIIKKRIFDINEQKNKIEKEKKNKESRKKVLSQLSDEQNKTIETITRNIRRNKERFDLTQDVKYQKKIEKYISDYKAITGLEYKLRKK